MVNYDAILKAINDKLAEYERAVEYYREEMPKKDEIIRKYKEENEKLKLKLDDLTK